MKNVIDSMASDYKEIEVFSVANNKGICWKLSWKKKKKDCTVCSDRNNPAIGCKRSKDSMHKV